IRLTRTKRMRRRVRSAKIASVCSARRTISPRRPYHGPAAYALSTIRTGAPCSPRADTRFVSRARKRSRIRRLRSARRRYVRSVGRRPDSFHCLRIQSLIMNNVTIPLRQCLAPVAYALLKDRAAARSSLRADTRSAARARNKSRMRR
ncbi:hypothetical protein PMAYCL1PPCAC_26392, partial [Pristionchus mayeri]